MMEKYVDAWWFCNQSQFKIQWEGFEEDDDTWEDADNIDSGDGPWVLKAGDDDFDLEDFYSRHSDGPILLQPDCACNDFTIVPLACYVECFHMIRSHCAYDVIVSPHHQMLCLIHLYVSD